MQVCIYVHPKAFPLGELPAKALLIRHPERSAAKSNP
jgi:hypothetical protein